MTKFSVRKELRGTENIVQIEVLNANIINYLIYRNQK